MRLKKQKDAYFQYRLQMMQIFGPKVKDDGIVIPEVTRAQELADKLGVGFAQGNLARAASSDDQRVKNLFAYESGA